LLSSQDQQPHRRTATRRTRRIHWILLLLAGLLFLSLGWLSLTTDPKVTALRNILQYRVVKQLGGPQVRNDEPAGAIAGTVRDAGDQPVAGAVVLVASPLGDTYTAETGAGGQFRIVGVPPGRYLPVAGKRGYGVAAPRTCIVGLCWNHALVVGPGQEIEGADLSLAPERSPAVTLDGSLVVSPTVEVEVGPPFPSRAVRTEFSFERAGLHVNDCYLYEPVEGTDPLPTLLLVLPGPVLTWEIIPVPFAAQGFSVLACYPLRGADIDADVADLLTALEYLKQGQVPSRADPERLGLIAASFTSLHSYRLLALTDQMDVALVLGGMADGFAFRRDVETGAAQTRPPYDVAIPALGFPNSSPVLYYRYSGLYQLPGLPPLCLLHGRDDELVPYRQSVLLSDALAKRGMPYEFHSYDGLKHYFSTEADNATTQRMFQDSLDCLRRWLESG
jgi:acetyl esterase/lipase